MGHDVSNRRFPIVYIDGIRFEEWLTMADIVIGMECQIENADDMDSVLRSVRWDSRLKYPESIKIRHLRLVVMLIQKGRINQLRTMGGSVWNGDSKE
jgi:hypothetical protein